MTLYLTFQSIGQDMPVGYLTKATVPKVPNGSRFPYEEFP